MSNRPVSLSTEPEWESPQGLSNEPPVDWPALQKYLPSTTPGFAPILVCPIFAISSTHHAVRATLVVGRSACPSVPGFSGLLNDTELPKWPFSPPS